ncbi:MAG: TdeIII family type II restriction endonuclease [Ignavibacteriales bacterium]|nr:TdeIII family type II restriction endonuclease [Ignavibacteriales bacterium]
MSLTPQQKAQVAEVLKKSLRNALAKYNPEPHSMPFHTRLLGTSRVALHGFIHSLYTNFGTTIFEPVAVEIGSTRFKRAEKQVSAGDEISIAAQKVIQNIMNQLLTAETSPDKKKELEAIKKVCRKGKMAKVKLTKVDLFLEKKNGEVFLIDLKTAKPNAGGFKEFKRTILEWAATYLAVHPTTPIHTIIGIPYNPYDPQPYARWTAKGMMDLDSELLVGEQLWDFLGGEGTYLQLLDIFEKVGIELRPEIDKRFEKLNQ